VRLVDASTSITLKVPFHDCDPLGVVWHGHYMKYFEQARCALQAKYELDVPHIRQMGYKMFVTESRCRYTYPLGYNDELEVRATFTAFRPLVRVAYRVQNLTQSRSAARGHTEMAVTDFQGNLLKETPREILERIPGLLEALDKLAPQGAGAAG
jgi:acyl-CoA thioester hydrolase